MTVAYEADQLVLISEPLARATDPEPSRVAADKVRPSHQSRLVRIAEMVDAAGYKGMTADEIHARVVLEDGRGVRSTWHGAVAAAAKEGLIVPRGAKHVRLSINNSPMTVYVTARHLEARNGI